MKRSRKILSLAYIYLILLLMYAPILVIIIFSFTTSTNIGMWSGFSFELYLKLFKHKDIMRALTNTLIIAISSSLISTLLGTLGAVGVYYSKRRTRKVFETVNEIPVVNAEVVVAISLAILFRLGVQLLAKIGIPAESPSFGTLLIGHIVLSIAFVYLSVRPKLYQMDPSDYEAALDLGAKPLQALLKIVLPAIMPGIIAGFMLAFTLSLDDFVITNFLRVQSFDTLSTYVQGVIVKSSIPAELRALTTLIFLVTLAIVLLASYKNEKKTHRKQSKRLLMRGGKK
ncbi:MAG TPA: ABC transporter permease [Bacilli bacterium]|jgi:spermidine/putrescine transport system permease protein|nr:ABC transporter permease [Bacilli bacterium]HPK86028.1 ABC transporter permease [Bacilli bacterium]